MRRPRTNRIGMLTAILGATMLVGLPAATQGAEGDARTVRIGYIAHPAIDGHVWVADRQGYFADRGITLAGTEFAAGGPIAQALVGGSLDVGIIGGAMPIFNCQGIVRVFVFNATEPHAGIIIAGEGIDSVADLAGKKVGLTVGTTAHIMLIVALEDAGLTIDDVEVVNLEPAAVAAAFLSKQVDAISPFAEFFRPILAGRSDAKVIARSEDYFPRATVMGGWHVTPAVAESDRDLMVQLTLAWLDANDYIVNNSAEASNLVYEQIYEPLGLDRQTWDDLYWGVVDWHPNAEWLTLIEDGTVDRIQSNLTRDFASIGRIEECAPTSEWLATYYDVFKEAYAIWEAERAADASPSAVPAGS